MHEVAHLEWVPPYTKSITQFADFSKDGITTITDLNKNQALSFHNSGKYWNPKLKDEFLANTSSLWDPSYHQEGVAKANLSLQTADKQAA